MESNRKGRLPWAIVLFIVALSILIAWGAASLIRSARESSALGSVRTVSLNTIQSVETVSDGAIVYDGGSILKLGSDGKTSWSYMLGGGISLNASDAGVAAWNGQSLTLINGATGAADFSGKMDANILSARIGAQYTAVVLEPEHNSTIVLMENGGRRVDEITLSGQTVVDYGFFYTNDSLFWVMALDTSGTAPSCTLSIYRPGRRIVGQITDSEQVIYHTMFQSAQICTVGNVFLRSYDYNCRENTDRRKLVYGWVLAGVDDASENPMMAFTLIGQYDGSSEMKDVRMIRGSSDQTVRMPFGCDALIAKNDRVYGFSSSGYIMIAQMGVQKVNAYRIGVSFDQIYGVMSGNVAVVGNGNTLYFVSLQEV